MAEKPGYANAQLRSIAKAAETTLTTIRNLYLQLHSARFELFNGENVNYSAIESMPLL